MSPPDLSRVIDHECHRVRDEPAPVAFVSGPDSADQLSLRIGEKTERIRLQGNVRTVLLAISGDAVPEFPPLFRRLDAHSQNLDFFRNVSFRFVNEGRHLGPAPGSPTAAVKENDRRGRLTKNRRKLYSPAVDVFQGCCGKSFAKRQFGHFSLSASLSQRLEHLFGCDGKRLDSHPNGIFNGIGDSRGHRDIGGLSDRHAVVWPGAFGDFGHERF